MQKTILFQILILIFSAAAGLNSAAAQTTGGVNRVEFFGGFSHNRVAAPYADDDLEFLDSEFETGTAFRDTFGGTYGSNGVNFSITGNFSKWAGAKFDVSTHSNSRSGSFDGLAVEQKYRLTNYLGGIQIKNNAKDGPRVKPFFHALAGVATQKVELSGSGVPFVFDDDNVSESQTNFALAFGGGIDVKVHKRVDIRLIQFDYNPTYLKETEDRDGKFQGNFRIGFGIVIH